MSISDEAVEAALCAYGVDGKAHEWERTMIVTILEAATPYMLREAQAEAWDACADLPSRPNKADNPYRNQP